MTAWWTVAMMVCLGVGASVGCAAGSSEAAFTTEHLRCVDKSSTLEESKACRAAVDKRWGVGDAGHD